MKRKLALLLSILMVFTCFMFASCGNEAAEEAAEDAAEAAEETAEETAEAGSEVETFDGTVYGYDGDDWKEYAVYQYLAEQIASGYEMPEGAFCVPVVRIIDIDVDEDDGEADVYGDFWVFNYVVEGDTLKCVSGGAHPGKMELIEAGNGYSVKEFEGVLDGGAYESSAKDIFEERYDDFVKVSGDDTGREEARAAGLATYVKANSLPVTKYQDEGWDPVDLPL